MEMYTVPNYGYLETIQKNINEATRTKKFYLVTNSLVLRLVVYGRNMYLLQAPVNLEGSIGFLLFSEESFNSFVVSSAQEVNARFIPSLAKRFPHHELLNIPERRLSELNFLHESVEELDFKIRVVGSRFLVPEIQTSYEGSGLGLGEPLLGKGCNPL